MEVQEVLSQVRDAATAKRVYGEPYERNGVVVITASRVRGVAGGGGGEGDQLDKGKGSGFGVGFGLGAAPVGAYVIRGEEVEWRPAIDATSLMLRLQGVLIVALLALLRAHSRR
jgi:uncharacterized spore protein YtfJ